MKKIILTLVFFLAISLPGYSQVLEKIDQGVNWLMTPITDFVESIVFFSFEVEGVSIPLVLVWLIVGACFFTLRFKFFNITGFIHALKLVSGKYDDPSKKGEGQVSHFQALTTALSGTVGLGNIAGVAVAIAAGGAGATFWMIVAGLLGMTSKLVECTLGVKYRKINKDGSVSGGPMYYLSKGLAKRGWGDFGKVLGVFFAVTCVLGSFGGGNMFQVNQARASFSSLPFFEDTFIDTSAGAVVFGVVMAAAVAVVIIGGIKSIAKVTDKIVPIMCGLYVLCALIILGANFLGIPEAFGEIFSGAFSLKAGFGGVLGVLVQGFKRAAFSNEAGIGSAAIAHSAVQTDEPVTEGVVALLEPFIDTVVICTMTALVIIITGAYDSGLEGVSMTGYAFENVFGAGANIILTLAVVLFAFSTMVSWSYYGLKSWTFLFGESKAADIAYKAIFCSFVVIGAILSLGKVVAFSDAMIFAMCFPNMIGLYILHGEVLNDLTKFINRVKNKESESLDE